MPSYDVKINVEHYENGGFGVIGYNYDEMGLITITEVKEAVGRVMSKELKKLERENEN